MGNNSHWEDNNIYRMSFGLTSMFHVCEHRTVRGLSMNLAHHKITKEKNDILSRNFLVLNKGGSIMDMCLVLTIADFRYSLVLLSSAQIKRFLLEHWGRHSQWQI